MHRESLVEMAKQLATWEAERYSKPLKVADIGCKDVNHIGTYRDLLPSNWTYTGFDLESGLNVDRTMLSEFCTGAVDESFDVVLCGQCLEHCRNPHALVAEIRRILRCDGRCYLTAPAVWQRHRVPIDCWRIHEDGMRALLVLNKFTVLGCYELPNHDGIGIDTWGIGEKPC